MDSVTFEDQTGFTEEQYKQIEYYYHGGYKGNNLSLSILIDELNKRVNIIRMNMEMYNASIRGINISTGIGRNQFYNFNAIYSGKSTEHAMDGILQLFPAILYLRKMEKGEIV